MISIKNAKKRKSLNKEAIIIACIFILPVALRIFITNYYVSFESILYSFFEYDYASPPGKFIGLDNYKIVLQSELFWLQMKNTVALYIMGFLFFPVCLIQALFLNEITKGHNLLRYLYVLPCGLPAMAGYSVWSYIWDPESGLANMAISLFGIA